MNAGVLRKIPAPGRGAVFRFAVSLGARPLTRAREVEQHISRFDSDPSNDFMVDRLCSIADGDMEPTQYDLNYYTHELREYERYTNFGWERGEPDDPMDARPLRNNTHTATLEDYGISDDDLFHPDVPQ